MSVKLLDLQLLISATKKKNLLKINLSGDRPLLKWKLKSLKDKRPRHLALAGKRKLLFRNLTKIL